MKIKKERTLKPISSTLITLKIKFQKLICLKEWNKGMLYFLEDVFHLRKDMEFIHLKNN